MISKEQIAHELAMIYMNNRYGINIEGSLIDGSGHIDSKHFPKLSKIKYKKIKTGEKGLFGKEKKKKLKMALKLIHYLMKSMKLIYRHMQNFISYYVIKKLVNK